MRSVAEREPDPAVPMPSSITEVIAARLDRLGEAKQVAQSASVIGRSFERPVLVAVSGIIDEAELEANLNSLIDHAIVEPVDGQDDVLQFRHALFHEASYRSVMRPDRVRIHGCGREHVRGERAGRDPARDRRLPSRRGRAGRSRRCRCGSRRAATPARTRGSGRRPGTSARCCGSCPGLPEEERDRTELKTRSRLVICLTAVDQCHPEALTESERVEELARQLGDRATLLRNYMVLVPWWQASAAYDRISEILARARERGRGTR